MMNYLAGGFRLRVPVVLLAVMAMLHAALHPALAQGRDEPPPATLSNKQLEQLLAPIALYPDALLTHVLMAAAYPFQVVQLGRWRDENPDLKGSALEDAVRDRPWDDSVKALAPFAQVVRMMNEKLDWTQQIGEAFLAQEEDVFAAIQRLRQRAEDAGNLKTTKEMRVRRAPSDSGPTYTIIEPVEETEVYVPVYDPVVVYGAWPYDDYPPYYWYPRGWRRDSLFWFGAAVFAGAALWAVWDWRRRNLAVNPMRFNTFFRRSTPNPTWKFNAAHRKGVPFKSPVLTKKFGPIAQPTALQKSHLNKRLPGTIMPKSSFVPPHTPKGALTTKPPHTVGTPLGTKSGTTHGPHGTAQTLTSKTGKTLVKKPTGTTHAQSTTRTVKTTTKPATHHVAKPTTRTVKQHTTRSVSTSRPTVKSHSVAKKPVPKAVPQKKR